MSDAVVDRIRAARRGDLPLAIGRMASGWLVLAETQPLRGYCQLLADPIAPGLNALEGAARSAYLADTVLIGDALLAVTGAVRINYETWANLAPTLHTHVVPRYAEEEARLRVLPMVLGYDVAGARRADPAADGALMRAIGAWLAARGALDAG